MVVHESDGCCHDEVKVIKLEQDQNKTAAADYSIPSLKELAITPSEFIAASFYNIMEECHFITTHPLCYLHKTPTCRLMFSEFDIQLIFSFR